MPCPLAQGGASFPQIPLIHRRIKDASLKLQSAKPTQGALDCKSTLCISWYIFIIKQKRGPEVAQSKHVHGNSDVHTGDGRRVAMVTAAVGAHGACLTSSQLTLMLLVPLVLDQSWGCKGSRAGLDPAARFLPPWLSGTAWSTPGITMPDTRTVGSKYQLSGILWSFFTQSSGGARYILTS